MEAKPCSPERVGSKAELGLTGIDCIQFYGISKVGRNIHLREPSDGTAFIINSASSLLSPWQSPTVASKNIALIEALIGRAAPFQSANIKSAEIDILNIMYQARCSSGFIRAPLTTVVEIGFSDTKISKLAGKQLLNTY